VSAVCPYCRGRFEGDYEKKMCQACATPHHEDCFAENGGCSVFGCVNAPGDASKIIIRLEDLGNDFPSRSNHDAATPGELSPTSAWQEFRIPAQGAYPDPPRLPWGLLVLFSIMTSGLFQVVWDLVLAIWMRKVQPQSRAIYYCSTAAVLYLGALGNLIGTRINDREASSTTLFEVGAILLALVGRFSMRKSLEDHFDEAGPMGLSLSGVMTFLFGTIYFQYHLNRLMRQKEQRHAIA
jgi:Prokaryotic RING finger family 1